MHQTSEFVDVMKSAWRHKGMILLSVVGAAILAFCVSFLVPKEYEAKTTFSVSNISGSNSLVDRLTSQFGDLGALLGSSASQNTNTGLVEEILKSRAFVAKIINELGLGWEQPEIDKFIEDKLFVNVLGTGAMQVRVLDRNPETAAAIANGLVETFVREQKTYLKFGSVKNKDFIEEQRIEAETRLRNAEDAMLKVQKEEGIFSASDQFNSYASALSRLETLKAQSQIELSAYRAKLAEVQEKLEDQPQFREAQKSITLSPEYQETTKRLRTLEVELLDAQLKYTDNHPSIIELKAQIASTVEQLTGIAKEHVSSRVESANPIYASLYEDVLTTEIQITAVQTNIKEIERQIAELRATGDVLADKGLLYSRTKLELTIAEQLYTLMAQQYETAKITSEQDSEIVRVIDPAIVPYAPARPRKPINALIGGVIALIISMTVACFSDYGDKNQDLTGRAGAASL